MKRDTKLLILVVLAVVFGLLQFLRPEEFRNIRPADDLAGVPAEVNHIIRSACFDCHSSQANLYWYDQVFPASFLVAGHMRAGRAALDFGKWDSLSVSDRRTQLYYSLNKMLAGEMPLPAYTFMHPGGRLGEAQLQVLKDYLVSVSPRRVTDSVQRAVVDSAYRQWLKGGQRAGGQRQVAPSINGIAYIPDYRNWKAISTTDRFDNGTMRIIFGNEVAIAAIQSRHTGPWPDGTIFAKAAWKQQVNADGSVSTGQFIQVEFMIKDQRRYAMTKGWGWARWKGNDLKPYGTVLHFEAECISCHHPVKDADYVFTQPMDLAASLHSNNHK